ncbi:MAG TPA: hypothetical protein VF178_13055 [Gemmatimonadaceae bacterium]
MLPDTSPSVHHIAVLTYVGEGRAREDADLVGFNPHALDEPARASRRGWALYEALGVTLERDRPEVELGRLSDGRWAAFREGPSPNRYWIAIEVRYDAAGCPLDRPRTPRLAYAGAFASPEEARLRAVLRATGEDVASPQWADALAWARARDAEAARERAARERRWAEEAQAAT